MFAVSAKIAWEFSGDFSQWNFHSGKQFGDSSDSCRFISGKFRCEKFRRDDGRIAHALREEKICEK